METKAVDTKVVAVINQKGGVGKTTTVAHLAQLAQAAGFATVVVDADQSASFAGFIEDRKKISKRESFATLLIANNYEDHDKLRSAVARARKAGAEWIFIDTAAGICALHSVAAELADLILIPTTPGRRDQRGTRDTVRLVRQTHKPAFFLISIGSQSKAINDAAVTGLSSALGLPASSTHIVRRQPTQQAELRGETLLDIEKTKDKTILNGQAEFRALWAWLQERFEEDAEESELKNVKAG